MTSNQCCLDLTRYRQTEIHVILNVLKNSSHCQNKCKPPPYQLNTECKNEDGYSEFLTPEAILSKLNITLPMNWDDWLKYGLKFAQSNVFGERELGLSSIGGRDFKLLDLVKLNLMKEKLHMYAPQSNGVQFEEKWSKLREKIGNACKRHK